MRAIMAGFIATTVLLPCITYAYRDAGYPDRQFSRSAWPVGKICPEFYNTHLHWN